MKYLVHIISFCLIVSCSKDEPVPLDRELEIVSGVIHDELNGVPIVIYADGRKGFLTAFERRTNTNGELLNFSESNKPFPTILTDQFGNHYDIDGQLVEDNEVGLQSVQKLVGYWFFFPSFYKEVMFYDGTTVLNEAYVDENADWYINEDFVFVGSFRDGIPSIDNPEFRILAGKELIENEFYSSLDENELATVLNIGSSTLVLPHRILEYHEVVNASHEGISVTVSFCPLTGTSKAWKGNIKGEEVDFGVSGLLYSNNLILYDRNQESHWSQVYGVGIEGSCLAERVTEINVSEMTVNSASSLIGDKYYLTTSTGFSFDYDKSSYQNYRFDNRITFPLLKMSDVIDPKERVLGIANGNTVKIYRFNDFKK